MYFAHSQRFRAWSKEVDETERRKERDKQRDLLTLTHLYFYDEHSPRYHPVQGKEESLASVSTDRDELRLASPLLAAARASARCQRRALSLTLLSPRLQSPNMTVWARPIASSVLGRPPHAAASRACRQQHGAGGVGHDCVGASDSKLRPGPPAPCCCLKGLVRLPKKAQLLSPKIAAATRMRSDGLAPLLASLLPVALLTLARLLYLTPHSFALKNLLLNPECNRSGAAMMKAGNEAPLLHTECAGESLTDGWSNSMPVWSCLKIQI
jgi:hypothetical protein